MTRLRKNSGFPYEKLIVLPDDVIASSLQHPICKTLYITDIGYFPKARDHYRERPSGCPTFILMYCTDGEGWYQVNGQKKQPVRQNQLFILPRDVPHSYGADEARPWSIYWVHFDGELAPVYFEQFQSLYPSALCTVSPDWNARVGDRIQACYEPLQHGYSLHHQVIACQELGGLLARICYPGSITGTAEQEQGPVERALRLMADRLSGSLSLDELSAHIRLSKPHTIAIFRQATGYSPLDYYNRLKIQRACQLLDLTGLPIKEICADVGFQDPYYFSRLFSRIMGMPPSEYRRRVKG